MTQILKIFTDRETDLEKRRTRYLATGNWVKVIQTEARLEEVAEAKKAVVETEANKHLCQVNGCNEKTTGIYCDKHLAPRI